MLQKCVWELTETVQEVVIVGDSDLNVVVLINRCALVDRLEGMGTDIGWVTHQKNESILAVLDSRAQVEKGISHERKAKEKVRTYTGKCEDAEVGRFIDCVCCRATLSTAGKCAKSNCPCPLQGHRHLQWQMYVCPSDHA